MGRLKHQAINLILQAGKDLGRRPPEAKMLEYANTNKQGIFTEDSSNSSG